MDFYFDYGKTFDGMNVHNIGSSNLNDTAKLFRGILSKDSSKRVLKSLKS